MPEISTTSAFNQDTKREALRFFKEKSFILKDGSISLINIINDKEESGVDEKLKKYLTKEAYNYIQNYYERYQRNFLSASIFVLNYYLKSLKDRSDEDELSQDFLYEKFKSFKSKSQVNHDSLEKLSFKLNNLYKAIGRIHGLEVHDYKGKVELPRSLIRSSIPKPKSRQLVAC